MMERPHARGQQTHSVEVQEVYKRVLAGGFVHSRYLEVKTGDRIHLLEKGAGPPLVLIHGTGINAGFFLPLLNALEGIRVIAPDRPGQGLSDPIDFGRNRYFETAVEWVDRLLDALDLNAVVLLGHSAGGVWALRYALAHPDRVTRLVLIGPPTLPKTRCLLPYRLIATPGLGELLSWLVPPSPRSVLQFASFMGEKATISDHPHLIDLIVAASRDPIAASVDKAEVRVLVSPLALLSPTGFRRRSAVRPDELRRLSVPTLLIWGEREPLGSVSVGREITELVPNGQLQVLSTGHAPWLGQPGQTASAVLSFMRQPDRGGSMRYDDAVLQPQPKRHS
jgi:pimeloyl-ACP methyl ester carboxylesterase